VDLIRPMGHGEGRLQLRDGEVGNLEEVTKVVEELPNVQEVFKCLRGDHYLRPARDGLQIGLPVHLREATDQAIIDGVLD